MLRLVTALGGQEATAPTTAESVEDGIFLVSEAAAIEARYGPNAYSSFLRKHGCRPDCDQAAAIGRLLGGRVRAADGSMQPPLSAADKAALRSIRARRKAYREQSERLLRLRDAVATLAELGGELSLLLSVDTCLIDRDEIAAQLGLALGCVQRFARDSDVEQEKACAGGQKPAGLAQSQDGAQGRHLGADCRHLQEELQGAHREGK